MEQLNCPECNSEMGLKQSSFGLVYECTCGATHRAHHNGRPLGVPANKETRRLRIKAHVIFGEWYTKRNITKKEAYYILAKVLLIPLKKAHIGAFDKNQCEQVIEIFGT